MEREKRGGGWRRETEAVSQPDRQIERQSGKQTVTQIDMLEHGQRRRNRTRHREEEKKRDRGTHKDRHADSQTRRQTDKQTLRQTDSEANRLTAK